MRPIQIAVVFLVLTALLSGCLSGEEPATQDDQNDDAGGGTVAGTIFTIHLEPVKGAPVVLVKDDEQAATTQTDDRGDYTFENVEPGEYRLQVSAACCRENVAMVTVVEGEVVTKDLQLEIYSEDDLQIPRVERFEWRGFLACTLRWPNPEGPHHDLNVLGVPGGVSGVNACGLVDVASSLVTGENVTDDDFLRVFEIGPGLKTVVGGMDWQAPGAALGDELTLYMEVNGRPNLAPRYMGESGPSPVEFRVDSGYVLENYDETDDEGHDIHQYDFENVEQPLELMYRIFAGGDANVVYQQQVTVYWELHYWDPAPESASALPDR